MGEAPVNRSTLTTALRTGSCCDRPSGVPVELQMFRPTTGEGGGEGGRHRNGLTRFWFPVPAEKGHTEQHSLMCFQPLVPLTHEDVYLRPRPTQAYKWPLNLIAYCFWLALE